MTYKLATFLIFGGSVKIQIRHPHLDRQVGPAANLIKLFWSRFYSTLKF